MFMLAESESKAVNVNYVASFVFRMFMLSESESKAVNVNYVASFVCSCCPRVRARQ